MDHQKRLYRSTRRAEQARETRTRIIEAARYQFIRNGYSGTTVDAIAQDAGVASETVYSIFSSKKNILAALINFSVVGDFQTIPMIERADVQQHLMEPDPNLQVAMFAVDITERLERTAPVYDVMRSAAKAEPEISLLLRTLQDWRLNNIQGFVRSIMSHSPLRSGLDEISAAESVWAVTSPELYTLLTQDHGWGEGRWISWLKETLIRLLLP
jgi:AcrR family transcriptional regulator